MSFDRYTDPECQQFLADLRSLVERGNRLKDRIDTEETFVGNLWACTAYLRSSLNAAEEKLTPNVEE